MGDDERLRGRVRSEREQGFAGGKQIFSRCLWGVGQLPSRSRRFRFFCISGPAVRVMAAWLASTPRKSRFHADAGLQFRRINRFLAVQTSVDCDAGPAILLPRCCELFRLHGIDRRVVAAVAASAAPSAVLGFKGPRIFDAAFVIMTAGILLTLPTKTLRPRSIGAAGCMGGRDDSFQ